MIESLVNLVFLVALGYYAYSHTNWSKPVGWVVGNVAWLVVCGVVAVVNFHYYLLLGLLSAVGCAVYDHFYSGLPFSLGGTLGSAFVNLFLFPVTVFEKVYNYLKSKV